MYIYITGNHKQTVVTERHRSEVHNKRLFQTVETIILGMTKNIRMSRNHDTTDVSKAVELRQGK